AHEFRRLAATEFHRGATVTYRDRIEAMKSWADITLETYGLINHRLTRPLPQPSIVGTEDLELDTVPKVLRLVLKERPNDVAAVVVFGLALLIDIIPLLFALALIWPAQKGSTQDDDVAVTRGDERKYEGLEFLNPRQ